MDYPIFFFQFDPVVAKIRAMNQTIKIQHFSIDLHFLSAFLSIQSDYHFALNFMVNKNIKNILQNLL